MPVIVMLLALVYGGLLAAFPVVTLIVTGIIILLIGTGIYLAG